MTTAEQPLHIVKENMKQGEFATCISMNAVKAFASVLLILGAFVSFGYLSLLNSGIVWLTFLVCIPAFVILYIRISKVPTFAEFLITDKFDFEDNVWFLIKSQILAWISAIGIDAVALITVMLLSGIYNPLQMAILKIIGISIIASSFFIYTKREDIWDSHGFSFEKSLGYALLGFAFGTSTYLIGGIIIVASALIGWELTVMGIGLEVAFTAFYTYMDLQNWVKEYTMQQERIAKLEEEEQMKVENGVI